MIAAAALIGSQAAAVCTVICLSQCARERNENGNATSGAEQAAWAVACGALTVSLAAQISGSAAGLTSLAFRVTELGAGIALLALAVAAAWVAVARQRAGRYAPRPDIRAVTFAAGAAVVLAAGMSMIVSGSPGSRPGQAFRWLCLLAAALAAAASLISRERVLAAHSLRGHVGEGGTDGAAMPARRVRRASRDVWDDWDRPFSGKIASADWDEDDEWGAPAGDDVRADEGGRGGQDARAVPDVPARREPEADWDPPPREHARADAAWADPGQPIHQDRPAETARADWDAPASKEPQASDEDASDWFRPASRRALADGDDTDSEAAASWEAPSDWFRPAKEPAANSQDAPPRPGADGADEPDLVSLPELSALRELASLPDLDVMPDLAALLGGSTLDQIGPGRHAGGRAAETADADASEASSPADQAGSPGVAGVASSEGSTAGDGPAAAGPQRLRVKQSYGRITVYQVFEQHVAAFDRLLGNAVDGVRAHEPDTLIYAVHKVSSVPLLRILYAVFRDKAAYRKHTESPYFQELSNAGRPLLEASSVIELGSRGDSPAGDPSAFS